MPGIWRSLLPTFSGAALGLVVWRLDAPASLALLLPFTWLRASTRLAGAGAAMAYYLAGAYDLIDAARMFFGQSILIGLAAWIGQAVILSIPWLLLWAPATAPGRPWRVAAVLLATAVPPFGLFNWLSPLLAAGEVFPAAGLWGLFGTILLSTLLATWPQWRGKLRQWILLLGAATIMIVQLAAAVAPNREPPAGLGGINTAMGVLPPKDGPGQFHRAQAVKEIISGLAPGTVTILPESIVGRWRPAVQYWLGADKPEGSVLLGADVPAPEGGYLNALVDARTGAVVASARIPMPISLWKPWASADSAHVAPWGIGVARVAGHLAAISICYEDFLLWPQLLSLPYGPDVLVSVANNWFVREGSQASNIQTRSIALTARLFDVPLVRAVNYPPYAAHLTL